jgi:hypothetical protein
MTTPNCCLTIVLPRALEEDAIDVMLAHPQWVTGFTVSQTEGAGRSVQFRGTGEHVRGRSRRVQLQVVLDEGDARNLLVALQEAFPGRPIAYWLTPVVEFGRLEER